MVRSLTQALNCIQKQSARDVVAKLNFGDPIVGLRTLSHVATQQALSRRVAERTGPAESHAGLRRVQADQRGRRRGGGEEA